MFSYYGSKSKIVKSYPRPKHDKIIEPFAGSARYSLRYWDKEIILYDKYEILIKTWKWLQSCSEKDILGLPDISKLGEGFDLRTLSLTEEEIYFLGFNAGVASMSPRFKISAFAATQGGMATYFRRTAKSVFKIKHWQINLGDYQDIQNQKATWFIDPPYEFGGAAYVHSEINYLHLCSWSQNREGQVIVCENSQASWMDFRPLTSMKGANNNFGLESIWTNSEYTKQGVQQRLQLDEK